MKTFLVALLVPLTLATFLDLGDAQLPPGSIMTVGTASSHYVSEPLGTMSPCPGGPISPARPTVRTASGNNPLSDPIVSFPGLHLGELHHGCSYFPQVAASDDSGAVGFDHYVQVVNYAIVVYDKSGNRLAGPISENTFWANQPGCGGNFTFGDAVVRFDRYANRWVFSTPGGAPFAQDLCMAVSQTSDPTGRYDQYAFEVNNIANGLFGFLNDYAKPAVFSDAYYAVGDPNRIFTGIGNTISAFERSAMLTGNATPGFVTFFVPAPRSPLRITYSHMLAADLDGRRLPPQGTPEYVVQVQDSHLGFPAGRLQLYEFHVNWNSPSSSRLTPTASLIPNPFDSKACTDQNCIKQKRTNNLLDSLSYGYMMQRLTYRNFGAYQTLLFNHTVAADGDPSHGHAGIRWYELRSQTIRQTRSHWEIYQQGTYAPDANDRWLGSMAMDENGNIAIGFGVSGHDVYPSLHYAGRRPNDPLGTLPLGEKTLIEGGGSQLQYLNFGDYSQMTLDPVDDCTFWFTGTYYPETHTEYDWYTQIGSFRFADCPGRD